MDNVKLRKGVYSKIRLNTYKGRNGMLLELAPNESDGFSLSVIGGSGNFPIVELIKTRNKDVFEIDYKEGDLFLEIYQDKVEIRSE